MQIQNPYTCTSSSAWCRQCGVDYYYIIIALQHSEDLDMVSDEQKLVLNEDES